MSLAAVYWIVVVQSSSENATFAKRHSPEQQFENAENHKCEYVHGNIEVFMFWNVGSRVGTQVVRIDSAV